MDQRLFAGAVAGQIGQSYSPVPSEPRLAVVAYSMYRMGAITGSPLYASAVRRPEPLMTSTSALPPDQPLRFTISWTIGNRSGDWYVVCF